jgi:hypothetical protein
MEDLFITVLKFSVHLSTTLFLSVSTVTALRSGDVLEDWPVDGLQNNQEALEVVAVCVCLDHYRVLHLLGLAFHGVKKIISCGIQELVTVDVAFSYSISTNDTFPSLIAWTNYGIYVGKKFSFPWAQRPRESSRLRRTCSWYFLGHDKDKCTDESSIALSFSRVGFTGM